MNSRKVSVLSVPHQLQGERFPGYVEDASYRSLVESLIPPPPGLVFEEAAGLNPSIAEEVAKELLGVGHYFDIDPSGVERERLGISRETSMGYIIDYTCDSACRQFIGQHQKREEKWLEAILAKEFESALMVCGSAHGLSFAFRLQNAGISEVELHEYIPYHKLCLAALCKCRDKSGAAGRT